MMQIKWQHIFSGKVLLIAGIAVMGLSYPATLACNLMQLDYQLPLYISVCLGTGLILWGMAKIFG